jgi:hypothetical protein
LGSFHQLIAAAKIGEWRAVGVASVMMLAMERLVACGSNNNVADHTERHKQTLDCRAMVRLSPSRQKHSRNRSGRDGVAQYAQRGAEAW